LLLLLLQFPEKMIPKFTLLAARGADLPIHGDGMAVRRCVNNSLAVRGGIKSLLSSTAMNYTFVTSCFMTAAECEQTCPSTVTAWRCAGAAAADVTGVNLACPVTYFVDVTSCVVTECVG
jgi:hypothetical protein